MKGVTVVQWLALSLHSKKVPGSIHGLTSEGHFSEHWLADIDYVGFVPL